MAPIEPCPDPLGETDSVDTDEVSDAAKLTKEEEEQIVPVHDDGPAEPKPSDPGFSEALANLMTYPLPADGEEKTVNLRAGPVDLLSPLMSGTGASGLSLLQETPMPTSFFQYRGSLTAPPCSEQVTWLVRREPLYASQSQIELIRVAILQANSNFPNARSVMPLMGRHILYKLGIKGDAPPPPQTVNDPAVSPPDRVIDFRGVASGKDAIIRALEASKAKDMIAGAIANAQKDRAAANAGVDPLVAAGAQSMAGPADIISTPLPTPNPERVLSRIVDAVAEQMDGSEKAAAMAAAGVVGAPAPAVAR